MKHVNIFSWTPFVKFHNLSEIYTAVTPGFTSGGLRKWHKLSSMCQIATQCVSQFSKVMRPAVPYYYVFTCNGFHDDPIFQLFFLKIGLISSLTRSKNRMGALFPSLWIVYMPVLCQRWMKRTDVILDRFSLLPSPLFEQFL